MQKVLCIDLDMDLLFLKEPLRGHLDAYLYETNPSSQEKVKISTKNAIPKIKASKLNPLYGRF